MQSLGSKRKLGFYSFLGCVWIWDLWQDWFVEVKEKEWDMLSYFSYFALLSLCVSLHKPVSQTWPQWMRWDATKPFIKLENMIGTSKFKLEVINNKGETYSTASLLSIFDLCWSQVGNRCDRFRHRTHQIFRYWCQDSSILRT